MNDQKAWVMFTSCALPQVKRPLLDTLIVVRFTRLFNLCSQQTSCTQDDPRQSMVGPGLLIVGGVISYAKRLSND